MNSEAHRGRYKGWEGSESPLGSLGCGSPRDFLAGLWAPRSLQGAGHLVFTSEAGRRNECTESTAEENSQPSTSSPGPWVSLWTLVSQSVNGGAAVTPAEHPFCAQSTLACSAGYGGLWSPFMGRRLRPSARVHCPIRCQELPCGSQRVRIRLCRSHCTNEPTDLKKSLSRSLRLY